MSILTGKITQNENGAIFVRLLDNPTLASIDASFNPTALAGADPSVTPCNDYLLTSDNEIFNSDMPPRWYTADSSGASYFVVPINRTQLNIAAFKADGSPLCNGLNGVLFEA